jgi:glutamate racemase
VGGLSIVQALRESMPTLTLSYLADNAGFPYGVWAEQDLIERVYRVLSSVVDQVQPCLIVVACNTASTVALPKLRATLSIPVVGVVPAIKPAAQLSQNKVIGLLGTPGTVSRHYTGQLIAQFAAHCQIIRVGSVELVHLAEQHLRGRNH